MKDIKIFPNYLCISENNRIFALANALVAELVDALYLGSSGSCRVGSSPIRRTL